MTSSTHSEALSSPQRHAFLTTRWTMVLRAKAPSPEGSEALRDLCAAYYEPVLAFLRREGWKGDAARDLAHGFFAYVLQGHAIGEANRFQGRFRSYLLGAVKHFLSHQREAEKRLRRGGGVKPLSLDAHDMPAGQGPPLLAVEEDDLSPDAAFDRQWALTTLSHALGALRQEALAEDKLQMFEKLRPCLTGASDHGDQIALAHELGLNLNSLKSHVHRLKRRFRALVKAEIASTLDDPSVVETEMASLLAVLRGS